MSDAPTPEACSPGRGSLGNRVLLLAVCIAAGIVVGLAGRELVGDAAFLAVPLFIALAWLWVGDPQQCRPPPGSGRTGRPPVR